MGCLIKHMESSTKKNEDFWTSLVAQMVKNLPALQETQVCSPGQGDPLEEEMKTPFRILVWRIPINRGA